MLRSITTLAFAAIFLGMDVSGVIVSGEDATGDAQITSFCLGESFGCVVFQGLGMKCFGASINWGDALPDILSRNMYSTLDGTNIRYGSSALTLGGNLPFVKVGSNVNINQVSCGKAHVCTRLDNGGMKCLGSNSWGQSGSGIQFPYIGRYSGTAGDALPIVNLGKGLQALQIATGLIHTCVKVTGGLVKCFGKNNCGQIAMEKIDHYGYYASEMGNNLPYVNLGTNVTVNFIQSGSEASHNCAILSSPQETSQRLKCWGFNNAGQLGYGDARSRGDLAIWMGDNLPLVDFGTESRVKQVSIGAYFTCILLVNDDLKCFGSNSNGNLGLGTTIPSIKFIGDDLPAVSIGDGTISSFTTGKEYTCIVYNDKLTLKCVGQNNFGQLGQGNKVSLGSTQMTTFTSIPGVNLGTGNLQISSVYAGSYHTCVVFVDSSVKCFGVNSSGQCAAGTQREIGTSQQDMGTNLKFAGLLTTGYQYGTFSPTSPTSKISPLFVTKSPTSSKYTAVDDATKSPTPSSSQSAFTGSIFAFVFLALASTIYQF